MIYTQRFVFFEEGETVETFGRVIGIGKHPCSYSGIYQYKLFTKCPERYLLTEAYGSPRLLNSLGEVRSEC